MIKVQIGGDERSGREIEESWISQQIVASSRCDVLVIPTRRPAAATASE